MTIPNQGYRKDLNLQETVIEANAIDNLGGAGISQDIAIIQNNLRNISTVSYNTTLNGYFYFGKNNEFVFTNDDILQISANVNLGSSSLTVGTDYYVCNSNAQNQFKLSTTPSSVGLNTITITSVSPTNFYFKRNDAVTQSNLINFIKPEIADTGFSYFGSASINSAIDFSQDNNQISKYIITKKYKTNQNISSTLDDFKYEGIVTVNDPVSLNVNQSGLDNANSPGVFIGDTRAFSSDNNPWDKVGTALSTSSDKVSIGELFFSEDIYITGISTEAASSIAVTVDSYKIPAVINGETYYLILVS